MEKKCWERFAALSYRAGTSLATILKSFATMVPWRKTSLRPSAKTASDRSARRHDQLWRLGGDSHGRGAGAGEAHGGAKTEEGTNYCNGVAARGAGVAKQPLYPDNSRETHLICYYRGIAEIESLQSGRAQVKQRLR